ncbi:hypothetical protein GALMADRAFT_1344152 [Galerina marginata CBS 339.88]|uniref:Uncharacterized protein n=1 Tax=Galerina marginata (strain CBS 339.88) TaxID=685588 RepID=A0A067SWB1_GALM3|nr:hypothetical protein GALMADRAFT_1344152 [Galerina marginata CBS 339.88]
MADDTAEPRDEIKAGDTSGDQPTDAPSWASFFSSRSLMVKTLGYGAGGGAAGAITAGGEDEHHQQCFSIDLGSITDLSHTHKFSQTLPPNTNFPSSPPRSAPSGTGSLAGRRRKHIAFCLSFRHASGLFYPGRRCPSTLYIFPTSVAGRGGGCGESTILTFPGRHLSRSGWYPAGPAIRVSCHHQLVQCGEVVGGFQPAAQPPLCWAEEAELVWGAVGVVRKIKTEQEKAAKWGQSLLGIQVSIGYHEPQWTTDTLASGPMLNHRTGKRRTFRPISITTFSLARCKVCRLNMGMLRLVLTFTVQPAWASPRISKTLSRSASLRQPRGRKTIQSSNSNGRTLKSYLSPWRRVAFDVFTCKKLSKNLKLSPNSPCIPAPDFAQLDPRFNPCSELHPTRPFSIALSIDPYDQLPRASARYQSSSTAPFRPPSFSTSFLGQRQRRIGAEEGARAEEETMSLRGLTLRLGTIQAEGDRIENRILLELQYDRMQSTGESRH